MKLELISAVLRPRADAEAVDLGLAMVRQHAAGIFKAWFTLLLPVWALLIALLHDYPSVMVFMAWWLKPLYDRVVVFYLGRALFGAAPTLREQVREWPRLLGQRWGLSLFYGRLSAARSFTMPVVVLEGLKGKLYRDRTAVLRQHGGAPAAGFMQLFLLLELAVVVGLWFGIKPWLPEDYTEWFEHAWAVLRNGTPPPTGLLWSLALCYLMAVALLEPFYAGGGFGLYINSRTHLEGWDVDLAFRQLGTRLRARATPSPSAPPLVLLALGFFAGLGAALPTSVRAAPPDPVETKAQIKEILAHPDFVEHVEKYREWVPDTTPTPPPPEAEGWDWGWLSDLTRGIANFFSGDWKDFLPRLLLTLVFVVLAFWLGRLLWKHRQSFRPRRVARPKDPGPRTLMGMDVTPESLPPDIPSAAWAYWQTGNPAAAVGLLYRGSLAWLMTQGTMAIRESDTEGDCLRHAGVLPDAGHRQYFAELTGTWLATAYGKSPPPDGTMRQLCSSWPFQENAPAPAVSGGPGRSTLTALLVLFLALPGLTGCKGKWVDRERELGHQGEAKRNPWLAATRFLELNHLPVLEQRGLADLPDFQSVMIAPAEAIDSEVQARRLLDWTKRGGHLIYLAEGGSHYRNDWAESPGGNLLTSKSSHPLLAAIGVKQTEKPRAASPVGTVRIGRREYKVSLQETTHFDLTAATGAILFSTGNRSQSVLASMDSGRGRITLVSNASAFRNRWIDNDDHAALLLDLVTVTDPVYSIVFIKSGRINLWDMLVEYAWPVLVALGLLLLAWLWSVLPRFGPVRTLPRRYERQFASHLDEAGTYLWKQHLSDALLDAPRQAVLSAARRHGMREEERLFTDLLATRAGLPPERVQEALYAGNLTDGKLFTRHMADLQTLLASLQFHRPNA